MKCADSWITLERCDADSTERARWLEQAVVGLDLPVVIAELSAIAGSPAASEEVPAELVRSWLGPEATAVLQQGLEHLPKPKIDELFRRPELLPGLQELAFTEGGRHWNDLMRQNEATHMIAREQRERVLGKTGLWTHSLHGEASDPVKIPVHLAGRTPDPTPAGKSFTGRTRRALLLLAPLAAAAAILAAALFVSDQPESLEQPSSGKEQVVIVKTVLPDEASSQPHTESRMSEGWPAHPLQELVGLGKGPVGNKQDVLARIAGSRAWSARLEDVEDLSAAQLRTVAKRARDAVSTIEVLAGSDGIDFTANQRSLLKSRCTAAKAELDHLQSIIAADASQSGGIVSTKTDISRVLKDVESVLVEACSREDATQESSATDGKDPRVIQEP